MERQEYSNMAYEHKMNIFKMKVFVESAIILFEDFPKRLDEDSRKEWKNRIGNMITLFESLLTGKIENLESIKFDEIGAQTLILSSMSTTKNEFEGNFSDMFSFNEMIYYQAIVMNYARIDAFFNDSIKCICEKEPGIMINQIDDKVGKNEGVNDKNITWKEIIDLGSYSNVIDCIINDFTYKLGLKSIKDRISFLNDKLKINISKGKVKVNLDLIYEGEQYRHSIVHKGGVVDKKLITTLNKEGLEEGMKIKFDKKYLWDIFEESKKLIETIAYETKQKYFKEKSSN